MVRNAYGAPAILIGAFVAFACSDTPTELGDRNLEPAVHESNSHADLSGMQNGEEITGKAVINFTSGGTRWQSTVNVKGNLEPGTYDFFVTLNGANETLVCSFTVDSNGSRQGCSSDTPVPGFNTAEIRDSGGEVVASGIFDRRGGNRF